MKTKEEEIIEGNKLIAEFMGFEVFWNDVCEFWAVSDIVEKHHSKAAEDLEYLTSWDWLMPVVEKIESLGYESQIDFIEVEFKDFSHHCSFNHGGAEESIVYGVDKESKIEAVFIAVTKFIQYYNTKKIDQ